MLATTTIDITGVVDVSSNRTETPGAAANRDCMPAVAGKGAQGTTLSSGGGGGGGGSYGTLGGDGGSGANGLDGQGAAAVGTRIAMPLGGCPGGGGGNALGGAGGALPEVRGARRSTSAHPTRPLRAARRDRVAASVGTGRSTVVGAPG